MIVKKNKQLAQRSTFGWAVCVLVILISIFISPTPTTASETSDRTGPTTHHNMTNSHGEHDMGMTAWRMPCDNTDCDNDVDCEISCTLNGSCGSGTATVAGPTCHALAVTSFRTRLSQSLSTAIVVSRRPDSLLRPPIA